MWACLSCGLWVPEDRVRDHIYAHAREGSVASVDRVLHEPRLNFGPNCWAPAVLTVEERDALLARVGDTDEFRASYGGWR